MKLQAAQYYTLTLGLIALLLAGALLITLGMAASRSKSTSVPVSLNKVERASEKSNTTTRAFVQITPEKDQNTTVQEVTIGGKN